MAFFFSKLARQQTREEFYNHGPCAPPPQPLSKLETRVRDVGAPAPCTKLKSWQEIKGDIFAVQVQVGKWCVQVKSDKHFVMKPVARHMLAKLDSFQIETSGMQSHVTRLEENDTAELNLPSLQAGAVIRLEALEQLAELKHQFGDMMESMIKRFAKPAEVLDDNTPTKRARVEETVDDEVDQYQDTLPMFDDASNAYEYDEAEGTHAQSS